MAIRKLKSTRLDSRHELQLRQGLVAELKRPDGAQAPAAAPVIYQEESGTPERYTRWYVVWKRFVGVDAEDRSRVILDAVEEVFGREAALRVSIAMGLTPDDPVAKDVAGNYELSQSSRKHAFVAEHRAEYGKSKRGRGRP